MIPLPTARVGPLPEFAVALIQERGGAWLVVNGTVETEAAVMRAALATPGLETARVVARESYGDIQVARFVLD